MTSVLGSFSRARALTVLGAVVVAGTLTGSAAARTARAPVPAGLPGLVHHLHLIALASLTACAAWCAAALLALVWEHGGRGAPGSGRRAIRLCPARCRHVLLMLCSAGVAMSAVPAATAAPRGAPDVPTVHAVVPTLERPLTGAAPDRHRIVVAAGDSLWSIAHRGHPHETASDTAQRTVALYRANAAVIGDDPDLIRPGQVLRAPSPTDGPR